MERRKFFKSLVIGGLGATVSPILKALQPSPIPM